MDVACTVVTVKAGVEVVLWLHTRDDPPREQWDAAFAALEPWARRQVAGGLPLRSLVLSDGGAPGTRQRAQLEQTLPNVRLSAVTTALSNPVKRGIATALAWRNPSIAFFEPHQIHQALAHLDLTGHGLVLVREFEAMQARLPPVETLPMVRRALAAERQAI